MVQIFIYLNQDTKRKIKYANDRMVHKSRKIK